MCWLHRGLEREGKNALAGLHSKFTLPLLSSNRAISKSNTKPSKGICNIRSKKLYILNVGQMALILYNQHNCFTVYCINKI